MKVNSKWYEPYRKRKHVICKRTKMIYEIVARKPEERLICIKTIRKFKFHAKWATVKHLNKRYILLSSAAQVLYETNS